MAIKVNFINEAVSQYMPTIKWLAILFIALLMAYYFGKVLLDIGSKWE
jgi:hypothetical protein